MKVNELWLKSFVATELSAVEISDCLTNGGVEVDSVDYASNEKHDPIFTFKIPPNRGDCSSVEGIAREIALLTGAKTQLLDTSKIVPQIDKTFPVRLENSEQCPRYTGCVVEDVNNHVTTPEWMKTKIEASGIRSVSAVVDILNYVMLELGQPMHAFDLETLDREIVVRRAKDKESITLLDDQEVKLSTETLIISDGERPQAIAGIMGGKASSVTVDTTRVFVESAYFDPVAIRLAGQHYGIKTDSSYRFERGVDPMLQKRALERAVELLVEITQGKPGPVVEEKNEQYLPKPPRINVKFSRIPQLLGLELERNELEHMLKQAGLQVVASDLSFSVVPPSYRQDLVIEVDIIEEIARIYGLHRLPSVPLTSALKIHKVSEKKVSTQAFKELLVHRGYAEAITYSFIDPSKMTLFGQKSELVLSNPISSDLAVMRSSLWPGLLQAIQYNQHRQFSRVRLFEMGRCFFQENDCVVEKSMLSGMVSGDLLTEQWGEKARTQDFYDMKADVENILALNGNPTACVFEAGEHPALCPGQTAKITRLGKTVGFMGALHPSILQSMKMEAPVYAFELEMEVLETAMIPKFQTLSKFPTIRRDLALLVNRDIEVQAIRTLIEKCIGNALFELRLFDIYQGKGIDLDKKSVALGLILGDPARTLKEEEANAIVSNVLLQLEQQFKAVLRE